MADLKTWDRCWSEASSDVPDYFSPGELEQLVRLRSELFEKYLGGVEEVSEFGAGLGHNLIPLRGTGRRLRAFDWSQASVNRCAEIGLEATPFNMFYPSPHKISGAALTVHAMEQLGERWREFLIYLLGNAPLMVIHIEPIEELYNHTKRDLARLAYHRKRDYLSGYLSALQEFEEAGKIELLEVRKSPFGGKDHDAYSVVVWRTR